MTVWLVIDTVDDWRIVAICDSEKVAEQFVMATVRSMADIVPVKHNDYEIMERSVMR
jgi:hypothetical protein